MSTIGELRDRIDIVKEVRTADGMGGWTVSDELVCSVWANVIVPASRDGTIADATAEVRSHAVRVRQSAETLKVQIDNIIVWRDWRLVVKNARPYKYQWIDFDCRAVLPE